MGTLKVEEVMAAPDAANIVNAVEYVNVVKRYDEENLAVRGVSFEIPRGEFVMLVGSSGGGKTTLMKMVNGLEMPTEGEVRVLGHSVAEYDLINLRRNIGYAVQGSVLFPHMNVASNMAYTLNIAGVDRAIIKERLLELLELVGLEQSVLKKRPDELSGGQQQRVGIARALASDPWLLLMDEPFGAVDSITRASLQDEMARIHKEVGTTVLFVTHDINEAVKLGTRLAVMDTGELQQYDTPEAVLAHPATPYVEALVAAAD